MEVGGGSVGAQPAARACATEGGVLMLTSVGPVDEMQVAVAWGTGTGTGTGTRGGRWVSSCRRSVQAHTQCKCRFSTSSNPTNRNEGREKEGSREEGKKEVRGAGTAAKK
jgi:hypothetical protein